MNKGFNEESDMASAAERHHQIMKDGDTFFRRLAWGTLFVLVLIGGFIIFFFYKDAFTTIFKAYP
jgi:hypothetical protein